MQCRNPADLADSVDSSETFFGKQRRVIDHFNDAGMSLIRRFDQLDVVEDAASHAAQEQVAALVILELL